MRYTYVIVFLLFTLLYGLEYTGEHEQSKVLFKIAPKQAGQLSLQDNLCGIQSIDTRLQRLGARDIKRHFQTNPALMRADLPDLSLILEATIADDIPVQAAINLLQQDLHIEYAEPIYIAQSLEAPNDPNYAGSLYLASILAEEAWDIHKSEDGLSPVLIAIVDTGVNWKHPDLAENIWQNPGEDANGNGYTMYHNGSAWVMDPGDLNGIDDDGNGFVDDLIGWNFIANTSYDQNNDPSDPGSHGTVVAGIAGGRTNNGIGIASISWNPVLMPLSCSLPGYTSSIFRGYDAIIYAAENGADIINCSWGGTSFSQANQDAVTYAHGLGSIIIAAGGNSNNSIPIYPAAYPNVVAVASLQNTGEKGSSSNFGLFIDVGAPTGSMGSTTGSTYTTVSNATSWASPVASGVTALIKSYNPTWTQEQIVSRLIATCDNVDTLNPGKENLLGSGKLNAYQALSAVNPQLDQILKLSMHQSLAPTDTNGNGAIEPGEYFSVNLVLRNYSFGAEEEAVTFTLSTSNPDVSIIQNSHIADIPADAYFTLEDAFYVYVQPNAASQYVSFSLGVSSSLPFVSIGSLSFNTLIHNGGYYVWEGSAGARNMSGAFIRDHLQSLGLNVSYGTSFPASLYSFDAVFLSYGNAGSSASRFSHPDMYYAIKDYLLSGGRLYIEGGDALGYDLQVYFPGLDEGMDGHEVLYPLLGIASGQDGTANPIDNLYSDQGWHTLGLQFSQSNQTAFNDIDIFSPANSGIIAFEESDYGCVAIQALGGYNQRSFAFSYALRELVDDAASTRTELLNRILAFFGEDPLLLPNVQDLQLNRTETDNLRLSWSYPFAVDRFRVYSTSTPEAGWTLQQNSTETFIELLPTERSLFYRVLAEKSFGIR